MLGFELHIGDIITYHCKRNDKQVIGYIYFIDKAKVYVCHTKDKKQSFRDEITHTEKMCVKINDIYSFNNLGIPENGEKLYGIFTHLSNIIANEVYFNFKKKS